MNEVTAFQLVAAGVHFVPAVIWAIVALNSWRFVRRRHPQSQFFRMLPIVGLAVTLNYAQFTLICLLPADLAVRHGTRAAIPYALNDCVIFLVVALARHMAYFFPTPERTPRWRWLAINYGAAVVMCGLAVLYVQPGPFPSARASAGAYLVLRVVYQLIMLGLIVLQVVRVARPGGWATWSGVWMPRRVDAVFLAGGLLSLLSWLAVTAIGGLGVHPTHWEPTTTNVLLDAVAGVGFVAPLAVRILGEVIHGLCTVTIMFTAVAVLTHGLGLVRQLPGFAELEPLLDLVTVTALVLVLVPGHAWLRGALDSVLYRRRRRRREELQSFLRALSPDLGVAECCSRALAELARVMQLRGAAIVLAGGQRFRHGTIAIEPVAARWCGSAAATLPAQALVGYELRELPDLLQEVVADNGIVGVAPIGGRGHLFISTGLLGAAFSPDDVQTIEVFADQLARILDGSDLLARVVTVERSLAHAEKLAAIGELAARVAHEIRNPVTAARSLAQQLCNEPTSPLNAEHATLIVEELDRVERQVAALLRFACREEFQLEPCDVGELARTTLDAFRPQLRAAQVAVEAQTPSGIVARADREKLRQVLINLLQNALDVLAETPPQRRLSLAVSGHNGTAVVRLADNGPGVPPEVLPRLFEPFFSRKPNGTGLGLAIAKRTVEAHGGRIEVASTPGAGMTVTVFLPLSYARP